MVFKAECDEAVRRAVTDAEDCALREADTAVDDDGEAVPMEDVVSDDDILEMGKAAHEAATVGTQINFDDLAKEERDKFLAIGKATATALYKRKVRDGSGDVRKRIVKTQTKSPPSSGSPTVPAGVLGTPLAAPDTSSGAAPDASAANGAGASG